MVSGPSPGPAPAAQARASSSRLTASSWRTWPQRKLRRKVPRVEGALTVKPSTRPVAPARRASASSMQSPPASADMHQLSSLSPTLALTGAVSPRSSALVHQRLQPQHAPRAWPAAAGPRRPPGDRRRRPRRAVARREKIASIRCSLSGSMGVRKRHLPSTKGCLIRLLRSPHRLSDRWIRGKPQISARCHHNLRRARAAGANRSASAVPAS